MTSTRKYVAVMFLIFAVACSSVPKPQGGIPGPISAVNLPPADMELTITGLSNCTDNSDVSLKLNSREPLVVLVHGCSGSAGRFRSLAQVYAFQGQQAVCFNYDDRESMDYSARRLGESLESVADETEIREFIILGHSQGGLIARRTLIAGIGLRGEVSVKLITVSSPFAGISKADHCGSPLATVLTLGMNRVVCYAISGDKWDEIHPRADFIREPGKLTSEVLKYLKVVTDEEGVCRRFEKGGVCIESDFVFTLDEQHLSSVDGTAGPVQNVMVQAGHSEIIGSDSTVPDKLIGLLQSKGLMTFIPPSRRNLFAAFLRNLYR